MNPKISVIVPVYNVEKYLAACVNSILNQTFQDFEIVLVDDGSTDESGTICDTFENEKIRVIHKKNGGLSDARNVGTENAQGEYITWIDSDDTIHMDYLIKLYSLVKEYTADLATCELMTYNEGESITYPNREYEDGVLEGNEALKKMLCGAIHGTSACGLLLKRKLAKKHKFPYGKYHEDDLTTYNFYMDSKVVAYTKQPLYFYLQRNNSIMHKDFGKIDIAELDAADTIYEICSNLGDEYAKAAKVKKIRNYCDIAIKYLDLNKIDEITNARIKSFLQSELITIVKEKNLRKKEKIKILLYVIGLLKPAMKVMRK